MSPQRHLDKLNAPVIVAIRDLGYVDGENIAIETRWAEGHLDRLQLLAAELVQLRMIVIVTHSDPAVRAIKEVTRTVRVWCRPRWVGPRHIEREFILAKRARLGAILVLPDVLTTSNAKLIAGFAGSPPTDNVRPQGWCGCRWTDDLWSESTRVSSPGRGLRRHL